MLRFVCTALLLVWVLLPSLVAEERPLPSLEEWQQNNEILDIALPYDQLVVAGKYTQIGGVDSPYLSTWNGRSWQPLFETFPPLETAVTGGEVNPSYVPKGVAQLAVVYDHDYAPYDHASRLYFIAWYELSDGDEPAPPQWVLFEYEIFAQPDGGFKLGRRLSARLIQDENISGSRGLTFYDRQAPELVFGTSRVYQGASVHKLMRVPLTEDQQLSSPPGYIGDTRWPMEAWVVDGIHVDNRLFLALLTEHSLAGLDCAVRTAQGRMASMAKKGVAFWDKFSGCWRFVNEGLGLSLQPAAAEDASWSSVTALAVFERTPGLDSLAADPILAARLTTNRRGRDPQTTIMVFDRFAQRWSSTGLKVDGTVEVLATHVPSKKLIVTGSFSRVSHGEAKNLLEEDWRRGYWQTDAEGNREFVNREYITSTAKGVHEPLRRGKDTRARVEVSELDGVYCFGLDGNHGCE